MNHFKTFSLFALTSSFITTSCIKNEAPNIEADILSADIENSKELLKHEPKTNELNIRFDLKNPPKDYKFAPTFKISKGATIEPKSGTLLDFSEPKEYTVTSQDKSNKKVYSISFIYNSKEKNFFSFENIEEVTQKQPFHQFFHFIDTKGTKQHDWASGNLGYNLLLGIGLANELNQGVTPEIFPTSQTAEGYKGKAAKLVTKTTGSLGKGFGAPLAAGNIFLGTFEINFNPLLTTKFGIPYHFKTAPKAVKGFFKYKAGEKFEKNKESNRSKDTWNAYAILFEKAAKDNFLTGANTFNDPRIVSIAKLPENQAVESDSWKPFEMNFQNVASKSFDANKEYYYTIVFSSSAEGNIFNGALESTLFIDEVELITE